MTYLKTLIILTTLALLTACAGGVTVNNNTNINGNLSADCVANPFTEGCNATPTQQEAFCRDNTKNPDDKTTNCEPTVTRLCGENPFQTGFCTPTPEQQATFCRDKAKTTPTKTNDCTPTVIRVCDMNPFDTGLCFTGTTYALSRVQIRATCTSGDENVRNDLCPEIIVTECTDNPFLAVCRLGTAGVDGGTYDLERKSQIAATCPNNVHDIRCHGVVPYEGQRQQIIRNCQTNVGGDNACSAGVVMQVCIGNPYNTILCEDPAIDYTAQRMMRLNECKANNTLDGCVAAAATTCPANPFQENLCFINDATYSNTRILKLRACETDFDTEPNCAAAQIYRCNRNPFESLCKGAVDYREAQIDGCARAGDVPAANTVQCDALFDTEPLLAGCLRDPFSEACDTEATFTDSKVSVRTKRFNFCEDDTTRDSRCAGYRTCNNVSVFVPLTCGADFGPVRMEFCMTPANAFDPLCTANNLADRTVQTAYCKVPDNAFDMGCVDNNLIDTTAQTEYCKVTAQAFDAGCVAGLIDAAAQLAYCKMSTANLFGTKCGTGTFTQARMEFCTANSSDNNCMLDALGEDLMYVADPCANGVCVETADWVANFGENPPPTTPDATTRKNEFLAATATGFADGATNGIMKPGITPTSPEIVTVKFADADTATGGAAMFGGGVYANGSRVGIDTFHYAGILAGTDLGVPITKNITTAVTWRGQIRAVGTDLFAQLDAGEITDFELTITFDGTEGELKTIFEAPDSIGYYYSIDGDFDDEGVIEGTVDYGLTTGTGDSRVVNTNDAFYSPGTLSGIIGASGAVGVFHSNNDNMGEDQTSFAGGFVALPPSPCQVANNCVNHALWLANARNSDNTADLTIRPAGVATINDVLGHLITGDTTVLDMLAGEGITVAPNYNVTLSQLSGSTDTNSGFGFAFARQETSINSFYAGLLSGTDVGVPFTNANQPAAEWSGKISLNTLGSDFRNVPFTLAVTFDDTNGGTIGHATDTYTYFNAQRDADASDIQRLSINGKFGANGVIYGGVAYRRPNFQGVVSTAPGSLSGLIGVNGAVAVFGNFSRSSIAGYGGGFVALPSSPCQVADTCVDTADWLASFTGNDALPTIPDATTRVNQFLQGTTTGFNTGANADIRATFGNPTTDIAIETLTFAEANTPTGGAAMFGGELYTAGTSTGTDFYYAGVLAGTDLGAPITENITSAKWTGQIRANANIDGAIINVADGADFELDITFDGAKGTITTIFARGPQFVYEIDGMFDENGIITGSVDYGAGDTTSGINMTSSVSSFYSPGTLTGIIGQNGAVGAFHSNNNTGVDQASFSGGFVVTPPAPSSP